MKKEPDERELHIVILRCVSLEEAEQVKFNLLANPDINPYFPNYTDKISLATRISILTFKHMNIFERFFRQVNYKWRKWELK